MKAVIASRHLWLSILQALDYTNAPNLPPQVKVRFMNSSEIREIVVKAISANRNWTSKMGPRCTRAIDVTLAKPEVAAHNDVPRWVTSTKLLPGGQYLLVLWREGPLQCYRVEGSVCIWSFSPSRELDQKLNGCDGEVGEDGELRICATLAGDPPGQRTLYVCLRSSHRCITLILA